MSGKILRIFIESYAGLRDIDIEWPEDKSIMALIADGGEGKSSMINFVKAALKGKVEEEHINLITKKARGHIDFMMDNVPHKITISKTEKSETIMVYGKDGMKGGVTTLRRLIGTVALDPFWLKKLDVQKQAEFLQEYFGLDTKDLDERRKIIYKERTAINSSIKELDTILKTNKHYGSDPVALAKTYEEDKSEQLRQLVFDRDAGNEKNLYIVELEAKIKSNLDKISQKHDERTELEKQIQMLIKKLEIIDEDVANISNSIEEDNNWLERPENQKIDIQEVQSQIDEINNYNFQQKEVAAYIQNALRLEKYRKESEQKSAALKEIDAERERYIKEKQPQVPGLVVYNPSESDGDTPAETRNGMYWHDKPIGVLSTTEIITMCVELQKAMNPNGLPILLLDDFESVGSKGQAEVLKLCQEEGYQAIVSFMDPKQSDLKIVLKNDLSHETEGVSAKKNSPKKKEDKE